MCDCRVQYAASTSPFFLIISELVEKEGLARKGRQGAQAGCRGKVTRKGDGQRRSGEVWGGLPEQTPRKHTSGKAVYRHIRTHHSFAEQFRPGSERNLPSVLSRGYGWPLQNWATPHVGPTL